MNKHTVITIIAIIVIVAPFAYFGLNLLGVQQLEYKWDNPGEFNFFQLSNSGEVKFCNTMPFLTSFQEFEIATFYQGKHMGSFVTNSFTINPYSSTIQEGIFTSDTVVEAQRNFFTLDYMFNGGEERMDPNKFIIQIKIDTPIIGIIPYSSTMEMLGSDFDKIMNAENLNCN
jgi:hypothetical protein